MASVDIPLIRRSITVKRFRVIGVSLGILATLTAVVTLALTLFVPAVGADAGGTEVFHGRIHPIRGASPNAVTNSLMTYHGGPISSAPVVYVNYWGSQWNTGFSTGGYTSAQAQTYINGFFGNVGGSSWGRIDTQYCQGVSIGASSCPATGVTHVGNQTGLLGGTWVDTTSIPRRITQTSIANAATRLMNHFGYSANAIYFVFTPSGRSMSGFGTQWCAWHDNVNTSSGQMAYAYQPYSPNAGASCGMNFVNSTNNSFGNGYFDGFSITAGHEWAEAETDMTPSTSVAWQGPGGGSDENADKCAWNNNGGVSTNISLGGHSYAVQPIWSNNSTTGTGSHCVTSHT
jgi:serine protease